MQRSVKVLMSQIKCNTWGLNGQQIERKGKRCDLPTSPGLGPHFRVIVLVRFEAFTVKTIASVYLQDDQ